MSKDILQLPFEIQGVLAIGYVAYRLATTGLDKHHRTSDFLFQVLVYGAIAKLAQELAVAQSVAYSWSFGIALLVALAAATGWRAIGNKVVITLMRKLRVTRENYSPSTWVYCATSMRRHSVPVTGNPFFPVGF